MNRYRISKLDIIQIKDNFVNLEFHGHDGGTECIFLVFFKIHNKENFLKIISRLDVNNLFLNIFVNEIGQYNFDYESIGEYINNIFDDDELVCIGSFNKKPYESERNLFHVYDNAYLYSLFNTIDDMKILKDYLLDKYPNLRNL